MGDPPLPGSFARTVVSLHGDQGADWLRALPRTVAAFARRWDLRVGPPFPLSYAYVAPAWRADGTAAVLKLCVPSDDGPAAEAAALRLLAGRGAARLLAEDLRGGALLLERCEPGTPLSALVAHDDEAATEAAGAVMAALGQRPRAGDPTAGPRGGKGTGGRGGPGHPFATQEDWGRGFARHRAAHAGTAGPLPAPVFAEAERRYAELCASTTERVLLHGDLHHDNILAAQRAPWLAIDPKGVIGDPAYEPGALLRNPWDRLLDLPDPGRAVARRGDQLAERLGLDRERVRSWAFAQAVLAAVWVLEDHGEGAAFPLACAELLSRP